MAASTWKGVARKHDGTQQYYTSRELAAATIDIARRYPAPYLELGVGDGALYNLLPMPKQGVEIQRPVNRLKHVQYGVDALKWKPKHKVNTVVMNPPFCKQVQFFNHASEFCDVIVWIAGLNARLWSNENRLNPLMHLAHEWLVPPHWCNFRSPDGMREIPAVVQVWKRKSQPRSLWPLHAHIKPCKDQKAPAGDALFVKRVGCPHHVGACSTASTQSLGTLVNGKLGTAVAVCPITDCKIKLIEINRLQRLKANGVIADLLINRSSSRTFVTLPLPILSCIMIGDWKKLIREIPYLDGVNRGRQW